MTCREFGPTLERFCSESKDFVDPKQLVQMATYFGIKGPELKKVKLMAAREQTNRTALSVMSAERVLSEDQRVSEDQRIEIVPHE